MCLYRDDGMPHLHNVGGELWYKVGGCPHLTVWGFTFPLMEKAKNYGVKHLDAYMEVYSRWGLRKKYVCLW